MTTLEKLRIAWLRARIAYHRGQAAFCSQPIVRSYKRDAYLIWLRNVGLRHSMRARELEEQLRTQT